jgi:hypothetical protein
MAKEIIQVVYARKPVDWHEIESGSRPDCGEAISTQVSEIREMTEAEYDAFIARPLAKREWLAGKGGYQGNIKQAIALVCPGRETLYVDPSGSDYGRYVGRAVAKPSVIKYPHIAVQLTGQDGNAFAILGACRRAARKADLSDTEIAAFFDEASAGDYNQLLATCMRWFDCR